MKRRTKDPAIELLRVIAACQVIGTHGKLDAFIGGSLDGTRVFISCLVGDGVAIFWMILGFFYFSPTDARRRLTRLLRRVLLPMAAFSALMFFTHDYIVGYAATLPDSLRHSLQDYRELLDQSLLRWQPVIGGTGHFWYLFIYALMVLITPVLRPLRDALVPDEAHERRVLLGIFALMVFNDLSYNGFLDITHHTTGGMVGAALWVLIGDIVYRRRELFRGRWGLGLAGLAAWLAVNAVRAWVQYRCYLKPAQPTEPLYWYSSYACISTLGLTVFAFGLSGLLERFGWLRAVVNHLGGMTFGVYLWHLVIMERLALMDVQNQFIYRLGITGMGAVRYQAAYTALVFALALIPAELTRLAGKAAGALVRRRRA